MSDIPQIDVISPARKRSLHASFAMFILLSPPTTIWHGG